MRADQLPRVALDPPFLQLDPAEFRHKYNRRPFLLKHALADHPLLQMPSLLALARRLLPLGNALHWSGRIPVDTDFDHAFKNHGTGKSIDYTIENIDAAGSFVVLNYLETDPEYADLIGGLMAEIEAHSAPLDPEITEIMSYVFISSPGTVTPYHMDREMNFLLQIHGEKRVHLWDASVMTEPQIETLLARPERPRPGYHPSLQGQAMAFALRPGEGVHHPYIAPHWVKNGQEYSISLALTYRTRGSNRRAHIHTVNHALRRAGITPRPFGQSDLADLAKSRLYEALHPVTARVMPLVRKGLSLLGSDAGTA